MREDIYRQVSICHSSRQHRHRGRKKNSFPGLPLLFFLFEGMSFRRCNPVSEDFYGNSGWGWVKVEQLPMEEDELTQIDVKGSKKPR